MIIPGITQPNILAALSQMRVDLSPLSQLADQYVKNAQSDAFFANNAGQLGNLPSGLVALAQQTRNPGLLVGSMEKLPELELKRAANSREEAMAPLARAATAAGTAATLGGERRAEAMTPLTMDATRASTEHTRGATAIAAAAERRATPEYRSDIFKRFVPAGEADARFPGYVAGIPDKPPATLVLPHNARLLGLPTPGVPGSRVTDLTPGDPNNFDKERFDAEHKLRTQYLSQADPFIKVRDAYSRVRASASDPSAAGDLALIFNYMKILDPGSVVREGEFATAQNAASVPERIRAQWNRALSGERLTDATRADFVNQSGLLFAEQDKLHQQLRAEIDRVARASRLDPARVLIEDARSNASSGSGRVGSSPAGRTTGAPRGGEMIPGGLNGGMTGQVPPSSSTGAPPGGGAAMMPERDRAAAALFARAPVGHRITTEVEVTLSDGRKVPPGTIMEKGTDGSYRPVAIDPVARLRSLRD